MNQSLHIYNSMGQKRGEWGHQVVGWQGMGGVGEDGTMPILHVLQSFKLQSLDHITYCYFQPFFSWPRKGTYSDPIVLPVL